MDGVVWDVATAIEELDVPKSIPQKNAGIATSLYDYFEVF